MHQITIIFDTKITTLHFFSRCFAQFAHFLPSNIEFYLSNLSIFFILLAFSIHILIKKWKLLFDWYNKIYFFWFNQELEFIPCVQRNEINKTTTIQTKKKWQQTCRKNFALVKIHYEIKAWEKTRCQIWLTVMVVLLTSNRYTLFSLLDSCPD